MQVPTILKTGVTVKISSSHVMSGKSILAINLLHALEDAGYEVTHTPGIEEILTITSNSRVEKTPFPTKPKISRQEIYEEIYALSHIEMARLWRFAPAGHKYFDSDGLYWNIFKSRFNQLGGMTQEISKLINR